MLTTYEPGLGTQSSTAPVWCAPPYREWAAQPPRLPQGHSRLPDEYPIREGDKRSDREPLVRQTTGRRPLRREPTLPGPASPGSETVSRRRGASPLYYRYFVEEGYAG